MSNDLPLSGFDHYFHSDVIVKSVNFNNQRLKNDVSFDLNDGQMSELKENTKTGWKLLIVNILSRCIAAFLY